MSTDPDTLVHHAEVLQETDASETYYYGDGKPVSSAIHVQLARNLDNFLCWRSQVHHAFQNSSLDSAYLSLTDLDVYEALHISPHHVGRGAGRTYSMVVAPRVQISPAGGTVTFAVIATRDICGVTSATAGSTIIIPNPHVIVEWSGITGLAYSTSPRKLTTQTVDITDLHNPSSGRIFLTVAAKRTTATGVSARVWGYTDLRFRVE